MTKKMLEFHDVANIFPMMSEAEKKALMQDIVSNGLHEPIWLYQGKIIDGRNRYIACIESGIKPKFRNFEGDESGLLDFVISLNLHRRHLTTSQKACLAAQILPEIEKQTKQNLSKKMSAIRKGEEVSAKLQNPNSNKEALSPANLNKNDIRKAAEMVKELGISEQKAKEYIIKHKRKVTSPGREKLKEVKFRIPEDIKQKISESAKVQNKSIAEFLRQIIKAQLS